MKEIAAGKGDWAMTFLERISGRKPLLAAFSIAALSLLPAAAAHADQFSYVFSGYADGTIQGVSGTDIAFTLTITEPTSLIVDAGGGFYRYNGVQATLVAGSDNVILDDVTLVANSNGVGGGAESVNFFNGGFDNGLGLDGASQLLGYALASNVTVPASGNNLTPTFNGGSFAIDTASGGGTAQLTGVESLGFTATDLTPAPTPEPSSLLLLTSGLPGLALLRRRLLKA